MPQSRNEAGRSSYDMFKISYLATGSTILLAAVFDIYTRIVDFIKSEFFA